MNDLENKTNNEILLEIKQLELDHNALKNKLVKDYDTLIEIERKFDEANKIILKRLKG
jgi:hypothetical protein